MARAAASPAAPMRKAICVLRISSFFRFAPCIILALLSLGAVAAQAARIDDLYRAQVVVSGRGEANRATGFAQCLEDVLVKVSGDPRLIGDPRVDRDRRHRRLDGRGLHLPRPDERRPYP